MITRRFWKNSRKKTRPNAWITRYGIFTPAIRLCRMGPQASNLLLNLASAAGAEDAAVLWGFIGNYLPGATATTHPFLAKLVEGAVNYYQDFVKPTKKFRTPTESEAGALRELAGYLQSVADDTNADTLQTEIFEIGKRHYGENLKGWFSTMYETLLGQPQGPRMGSFFKLYGREASIQLINKVISA